jgi:hypothetical protein
MLSLFFRNQIFWPTNNLVSEKEMASFKLKTWFLPLTYVPCYLTASKKGLYNPASKLPCEGRDGKI